MCLQWTCHVVWLVSLHERGLEIDRSIVGKLSQKLFGLACLHRLTGACLPKWLVWPDRGHNYWLKWLIASFWLELLFLIWLQSALLSVLWVFKKCLSDECKTGTQSAISSWSTRQVIFTFRSHVSRFLKHWNPLMLERNFYIYRLGVSAVSSWNNLTTLKLKLYGSMMDTLVGRIPTAVLQTVRREPFQISLPF